MLLDRQLRTDADFDAFCLDFFPHVYRRFTSGMERTQKVNLLLTIEEDLSVIAHRLRATPGSPRKPWWRIAGCAILLLGMLLAVRVMRKPVRPVYVEPPSAIANLRVATGLSATSAVPLAATPVARPPTGINVGNQIVNSPAAKMKNSAHVPGAASSRHINSGNRIENSPGAKMFNTLDIAGSR